MLEKIFFWGTNSWYKCAFNGPIHDINVQFNGHKLAKLSSGFAFSCFFIAVQKLILLLSATWNSTLPAITLMLQCTKFLLVGWNDENITNVLVSFSRHINFISCFPAPPSNIYYSKKETWIQWTQILVLGKDGIWRKNCQEKHESFVFSQLKSHNYAIVCYCTKEVLCSKASH